MSERWRLKYCLAALGVGCVPHAVYAVQYFTVTAVQQRLFPLADRFDERRIILTVEQRKLIEARSNVRVRDPELKVWEAYDSGHRLLGYMIVDEVLGKHDQIGYALAISSDGSIAGLEIMEYRELYGERVRDQRWRKQFVGKTAANQLMLDVDIQNISGATLSCSHVTQGVRRLMASFEVTLHSKSDR